MHDPFVGTNSTRPAARAKRRPACLVRYSSCWVQFGDHTRYLDTRYASRATIAVQCPLCSVMSETPRCYQRRSTCDSLARATAASHTTLINQCPCRPMSMCRVHVRSQQPAIACLIKSETTHRRSQRSSSPSSNIHRRTVADVFLGTGCWMWRRHRKCEPTKAVYAQVRAGMGRISFVEMPPARAIHHDRLSLGWTQRRRLDVDTLTAHQQHGHTAARFPPVSPPYIIHVEVR